LPFLGNDREVYVKTNTADLFVLQSMPFIFINGNLIEKFGSLNMYNFAEAVLKRLEIQAKNPTFSLFDTNELKKTRPLFTDKTIPEYLLLENKSLCSDFSICGLKNLNNYKILYNDLLFGKQYSMKKIK